MRMLTKLLFGESGTHTGERCLLLLSPCYFVPRFTLYIWETNQIQYKRVTYSFNVSSVTRVAKLVFVKLIAINVINDYFTLYFWSDRGSWNMKYQSFC